MRPPRIVMVAGEASGDIHGAALARALRQLAPEAEISGLGGPSMAAAGVDLLRTYDDLAVVGVAEVLPKLGHILAVMAQLKGHLGRVRPDLVILIDFPDFNFRIGRAAKKLGLKVLYYISPQLWAWRRGRARQMARFVDALACVFPFEEAFFRRIAPNLPVSFVGHPLLDRPPDPEAEEPLPGGRDAQWVGLLPGSRMSEVSRLAPLMMAAARIMAAQRPELRFVLPLAPGLDRRRVEPFLADAPVGLLILDGQAERVMRRAQALVVASGTATLQAALAKAPMVVVYKTGKLSYHLGRALIKVEHIAMPNLIFGGGLLTELIQDQATPQAVAAETLAILGDAERRQAILEGLELVRGRLGQPGANQRVARLAMDLIEGNAH